MQHTRSSIRIWDLPTRLFHWALAACVVGAYVSVKLGGLYMDWHVRFGLATLGLIAFRLAWGLFGPRYAGLLKDIYRGSKLADDPSIYLHHPTATDPAMAPRADSARLPRRQPSCRSTSCCCSPTSSPAFRACSTPRGSGAR